MYSYAAEPYLLPKYICSFCQNYYIWELFQEDTCKLTGYTHCNFTTLASGRGDKQDKGEEGM
jgi:hypothetical protein